MSERLADPSDLASEQEAIFHANHIRDVQKRLEAQQHPDFDGIHCLDCAVGMPVSRLEDGRIRCTDCETLREKKSKLFGKGR